MENKLFELAAARRSIRKYTSEHISDEILHEIMKVALTAPCSFGHRPAEFVVVKDKIRELAACKSLGGKGETKRAYREEDFDFGKVHYEKY